jgi:hypothetical protein
MSTEEKTAVESGAPAAAAPAQPAAEPITKAKIHEFRTKRDHESIKKTIKKLESESATDAGYVNPAPPEQEPAIPGTPAAAPAAAPTAAEVKKFKDKFHGKEFELDDADGFLGYKNLENLKRENAHKRLYLAEVEEKEKTAREQAAAAIRDVEETKRLLKAAQDQLAIASKAPGVAAPSVAPAQTVPKAEVPKVPKRPAKMLDPLDEESQVEWQKYFEEAEDYQVKVESFLSNLKPEVRAEIPQEFRAEFDSLKTKVAEYEQHFSTAKSQKAKDDADQAVSKMWNARAEFQSMHKDYATAKPLKEIDKELIVWSDRLASLNGLIQPSKPFNIQDPEWFNYEKARIELIGKYANGDQKVVESAGTFVPPEEYKKFYAVMELEQKKNQMINEGILGQKATLHDAFVKDFDASGRMAETLSAVEKENLIKGVKGVTQALDDVRNNTAVTLPPEVGGKGNEGASTDISKLSKEEKEKILGATVPELRADPELRRKKAMILASLSTT